MKKQKSLWLLALLAMVFFNACDDSPLKDFDESESGVKYKMHIDKGDTLRAKPGDVVFVRLAYRTANDSIFEARQANQAIQMGVGEPLYPGDVYDAMMLMGMGDSATFALSTDSFFLRTVGVPIPDYLDSNSYFFMDMAMDSIVTADQIAADQENMRAQLKLEAAERIQKALADGVIKGEADDKGIVVEFVKKGKGALVESGKFIKMHMRWGVVGDLPIQDTWLIDEPQHYFMGMNRLGAGFEEVLATLHLGDHVKIMVPSELAFGESQMGNIPPYSPLIFEVELIKLQTEEQVKDEFRKKEKKDRDAYLKEQGISNGPDENGMYITKVQEGNGATPAPGQRVSMHYTGTFLNGQVFDSSMQRGQPYSFTLGQGEVIQGWDKIAAKMKVGDKWKVVIPSEMAYGESGMQGGIPPFTTLVFEMELMNVQ